MAEKVSRLNFERKDKQKTSVVSDNSHNTLQSKKHSSHTLRAANQLIKVKPPIFKVIYEGKDVTPLPLSPLAFEEGKERPIVIYDMSGGHGTSTSKIEQSPFKTLSTAKFQSELQKHFVRSQTQTFAKSLLETEDIGMDISEEKLSSILSVASAGEEIPGEPMPPFVNLTLVETNTEIIFDLPSQTAEKDTPEGQLVDADNKLYEHLTVGKGRNRKVVNQEIQTAPTVLKTRETQKDRVRRSHNHAFASAWDMFDTYAAKEQRGVLDTDSEDELLKESKHSIDSYQMPSEDKQMIKLMRNQKFQEACIVIERLLANNNFNEQQKRFRGLTDPDPFRENIEYNYTLRLLWSFANNQTHGRSVSCMRWNPKNKDILAVGYGKFFFNERCNGIIMLWNIKNPVQPERHYTFESPVSSLDWSKTNPNLLAVGLYNGFIAVLDVSSRLKRLIAQTNKESFPNFMPVWQVNFELDSHKTSEYLISMGEDGKICKTGPVGVSNMLTRQIMRVSKCEGKIKGLETMRKCLTKSLQMCRYPAALVGNQHPNDKNVYFVGTNDGVVHQCSKHYFHQHLDAFLAHDGPIYQIKFSPFCGRLMLTCGDDWYMRIWGEGVAEPVLELKNNNLQSIQDADFSPSHSTIIASVSGKDIHIWDLQRKVYTYQSSAKSPTNHRNTAVQFTDDGRCLTVADIGGNVHIFALEDMPFSAFFQADHLTQSLKKALVTKQKLLKQLLRTGSLVFEPEEDATGSVVM